jgi:hypothetical protein
VRLRLEFTTEPFDLDEPPPHAVAAREVVLNAPLEAVEVGPFGNTAVGGADAVLAAVDTLLRRSLAVGATRISLQVNAIAERPTAESPPEPEPRPERDGLSGRDGAPGPEEGI